jgi:hypothetical protein
MLEAWHLFHEDGDASVLACFFAEARQPAWPASGDR